MTSFLAIGSGKGGTGKTLVAVSLAHALAQEGEKVLLCDADLGLSNTCVHLGLDHGGDLAGVIAGRCALADAVVPVFGGIKQRGGFDVLAAPAGSGALADIDEAQAHRLIETLRAAKHYDRIVLDLGAGVDAITMHFAAAADSALLVMTPDPASLADAYAFAKLLEEARRGGCPSSSSTWRRTMPKRGAIRRARHDMPGIPGRGAGISRRHLARSPRRQIRAPPEPCF